jgi:hypothetical protein
MRIDTRFANFSSSASPRKHFLADRLPGLHHIIERPDRNSTIRPRNFASSALSRREELRFPSDPQQGLENQDGEDNGDGKPTPELIHAPDSNTVAQSCEQTGRWISELSFVPGHLNIRWWVCIRLRHFPGPRSLLLTMIPSLLH